MSLDALKFVDTDYTGKGASSMPDTVSGTPATNKAKFDELVKDIVAVKVNALIDALMAETDGSSGADQIGCTPVSGIGNENTDTIQEVLDAIGAALAALAPSAGAPSGMVGAFAMVTPPVGWLACDGSAVSRETYATLFSAIGEIWGAGDGSTTFNVPDFRGYFLRGWNDEETGADPERVFGSEQADQNKAHTHTVTDAYDEWTSNHSKGDAYASRPNSAKTTQRTTSSNGGTEARPINKPVLYCIKT